MKAEKVDNSKQPMKASMLPGGLINGNRVGDGVEPHADGRGGKTGKSQPSFGVSELPGAFISMTAGANPDAKAELDNGPRGDESVTTDQLGDGQKKRTVTGRDQSPYDVK
jgi:hypothetical protein